MRKDPAPDRSNDDQEAGLGKQCRADEWFQSYALVATLADISA